MNPAPAAIVQRVTQDSTITPSGQLKLIMRVQYMVGDHGPFTMDFPADTFKATDVQAQLQAQAAEINALSPPAV